ncbi:phosphoribosylanthranilate isomerase [Butyrivibrio sp. INlla16]|uniref:phosphoribosylanthranilate isomerase n=1 Tax=Butyrivibrio sp. INlla16 TaxID=1520807 RepID=UPI0008868296|nr:phosphoribosylanthranilate isomerase [Butyrivibrio sp. INlla16]SDB58194.1 phosphoribosylanthranilate isomerase [Butyrivibrio sp. INlla16]
MIKTKFCGLTRPEDIQIVNRLKPDYIGFVFFKKSKRNVEPEEAKKLKEKLDSNIKAVGVFVDEKPEFIAGLANENIIDIIQLHGNEDEKYIGQLRKLTAAKIIKAFQIKNYNCTKNGTADFLKEVEASSADIVLIDSGQGTGTAFNWEILKKITRPYFLAGGINTANIEEAVTDIKPYAIDVSSGIETDGVKDEEKMSFILSINKK